MNHCLDIFAQLELFARVWLDGGSLGEEETLAPDWQSRLTLGRTVCSVQSLAVLETVLLRFALGRLIRTALR